MTSGHESDVSPSEEQMAGWSAGIPVSEPPTAEPVDGTAGDPERREAEGVLRDGTSREGALGGDLEEEGAP